MNLILLCINDQEILIQELDPSVCEGRILWLSKHQQNYVELRGKLNKIVPSEFCLFNVENWDMWVIF